MTRSLSLTVLLSLLCLACGDDDAGAACRIDGDCPADNVCVDSRCVANVDAGVDVDRMADAPFDAGDDSGPACTEDCGDGDCIDGVCCAAALSCDGICCAESDVCSFNACVTPGETCAGSEDCESNEYCEPRLAETMDMCGGEPTTAGRCLPEPPACPDGVTPDPASPECIASCRFEPPSGGLNVELAYAWGEFDGDRAAPNVHDVRNSPIVINLDDDDCDGRITARDIPEIVVFTSPDDTARPANGLAVGDIVVLSVQEGELQEKWRVAGAAAPWTYPAAGDFHSNVGNELVVCSAGRDTMRAYGIADDELTVLWEYTLAQRGRSCGMTAIFDIDQDGDVEILTLDGLLDGETGTLEYPLPTEGPTRPSSFGFAVDVDNDPAHQLELVFPDRVFQLRGGALEVLAEGPAGADHAIPVQLDGVGGPEIVSVDFNTHTLSVWNVDGSTVSYLRRDLDINGTLDPARCGVSSSGFTSGGGPPTAADVNGDGVPDVAIAGGVGYAVLDGARLIDSEVDDLDTFFWTSDTVDCSSAQTGSSVFDFNGDGRAEVLYADEHVFRIYGGEDGEVLFETCNTNGTIFEQPIVADVDNDGQADIVVVSNARYRNCLPPNDADATSGVRVFSSRDGDWVRTRRVWNQHAYSITNVGEDGSIPQREEPNWDSLNNYRLNQQPGSENAAPDVVVQLAPLCSDRSLQITVRNLGESVLPSGVRLEVYRGPAATPEPANLLAELLTTQTLYPAQAQTLLLTLDGDDRELVEDESLGVLVIATPPAGTPECRAENNTVMLSRFCTLL